MKSRLDAFVDTELDGEKDRIKEKIGAKTVVRSKAPIFL